MKVSCKVIEDMLPIYHDAVCSLESATLIEAHLKECPQCRQILTDLHSEIEISEMQVDDLKPLENIEKKWKKSKRTYIRRGICFTLTALLFVMILFTGIWYFSYGKYWYQLTDVMEQTTKEDMAFTSSDYMLENGSYRFDISMPVFLSDSGFVRVTDDKGLVMFLYPQAGGSYTFWLCITDQNNESYSVYLKSNLTPDFDNHPFPVRSESEKQKITQLLINKNEDVVSMLDEIYALWGIDLTKYVP